MNCPTCKQPGDLAAIRTELQGQIDSLDSLRDSIEDGETEAALEAVVASAKRVRAILSELDT